MGCPRSIFTYQRKNKTCNEITCNVITAQSTCACRIVQMRKNSSVTYLTVTNLLKDKQVKLID